MRTLLISGLVALIPGAASAVAVESKQLEMHICKINPKGKTSKLVRTVKIETEKDLCVVKYSRDLQEKMMGQTKTIAGCKKIADNIKINLEKAGWTCRTTTKAQTTESPEVIPPPIVTPDPKPEAKSP